MSYPPSAHKESLETLLEKILAHDDDWSNIKAFCSQVAQDRDAFADHRCAQCSHATARPLGAVQMVLNQLRNSNVTIALRALTAGPWTAQRETDAGAADGVASAGRRPRRALCDWQVPLPQRAYQAGVAQGSLRPGQRPISPPQYTPNTPKVVAERVLFNMEYWSYNLPDQASPLPSLSGAQRGLRSRSTRRAT